MLSCEFVRFCDLPDLLVLSRIPTVCVISAGSLPCAEKLENFVKGCLDCGAIAFVSCGPVANLLEDAIDEIIERRENYLWVLTTAHVTESEEDVAIFAVNSIYLEEDAFRVILVGGEEAAALCEAIKRFAGMRVMAGDG